MVQEELWPLARQSFETDDGSLPTIELRSLTPSEVADTYATIRQRSRLVSTDVTFWDDSEAADRALDDVPNAAILVATGQAAPFHVTVEAVELGIVMPTLGVHVFQDLVAIDYRMGAGWGKEQVFAFFLFLERLVSKTVAGVIVPSLSEGPPDPTSFVSAWRSFIARGDVS